METILIWTLMIAAVAIVSMLVLLIASERELTRNRVETESLRAKLENAGAAVNPLPDTGAAISEEVARLSEQVRANEVVIATMQCELEALRAENSWLKQEVAAYQVKSPETETHLAESVTTQIDRPAHVPPVTRLDLGPRRSRLIFPATAVALLLVALVSIFFARSRTTHTPARQAESPAEVQIQGDLATVNAITAIPNNVTIDADLTPKTLPTKKRTVAPAGASYEVVRSTRVFSQPTDSSHPLARIEAGTEVDVVGARDEWLEVRSRHGRPPGFIRKDAVIAKGLR